MLPWENRKRFKVLETDFPLFENNSTVCQQRLLGVNKVPVGSTTLPSLAPRGVTGTSVFDSTLPLENYCNMTNVFAVVVQLKNNKILAYHFGACCMATINTKSQKYHKTVPLKCNRILTFSSVFLIFYKIKPNTVDSAWN